LKNDPEKGAWLTGLAPNAKLWLLAFRSSARHPGLHIAPEAALFQLAHAGMKIVAKHQ
jgi:hypothetical protein